MGAGASVVTPTFELMSPRNWSDPDVKHLWESCEQALAAIYLKEREFLLSQQDVMFRKHDQIIRIIMSKTKKQLRKLINGKVPGSSMTVDELESLGGGPYAKFLGAVCVSELDCRLKELNLALGGVGCKEDNLLVTLSMCGNLDLRSILQANPNLVATITGKTKSKSHIQNFLLRILQIDRDGEEVTADADLAMSQAAKLKSICGSSGTTQDSIFDILCKASRNQCQEIDKVCQSEYSMPLLSIIESNFTGNVQLALALWTLQPAVAAAYLLNHLVANSCDSALIARVVAMYDKPALKKIDEACKQLYSASLYEKLSPALSGNFAKAVSAWISSTTVDGGNEALVEAYIAEQMVWRADKDIQEFLFEMAKTDVVCSALKTFLTQEKACLGEYMNNNLQISAAQVQEIPVVEQKAPLAANGGPKAAHRASRRGAAITAIAESKKSAQRRPDVHSLEMNEEFEEAISSGLASHSSFMDNLKVIEDYLFVRYCEFDKTAAGSLPCEQFWKFYDTLPLLELGFTKDEAESMKLWVEWDHDGWICFDEIKEELADAIVDSLCGLEKNIPDTMDKLMKEAAELHNSATSSSPNATLPPTLLGYLETTFNSYDLQHNGKLDWEEFWQLLNAISLGVTALDYAAVVEKWDGNKDGVIDWSEALVQFHKVLGEMLLDNQDHWIGLVDKETGALFWYNLADESSQWMSEEDQANYRAHTEAVAAVAAAAEVAELPHAAVNLAPPVPKNPQLYKRKAKLGKKIKQMAH